MLLLMTIEPGFGGQQFMDFVLPKIRRAREPGRGQRRRDLDPGGRRRHRGDHRPVRGGRRGHVRGRVGGVRLRRPSGPGEGTARHRLRPGARYRLGGPRPKAAPGLAGHRVGRRVPSTDPQPGDQVGRRGLRRARPSTAAAASYSSISWMASAASRPAIRPASSSAMSMPADTPAPVTYLPSITTRSLTGCGAELGQPVYRQPVRGGPAAREQARRGQDQRAGADRGGPAGDLVGGAQPVVHRAVGSICVRAWPGPPGTSTMSGCGSSAMAASATRLSIPVSVGTGPACSATNITVRARQPAQHLVRPDGVQGGEPVVQQDRDLHGQGLLCVTGGVRSAGGRPRAGRPSDGRTRGAWPRAAVAAGPGAPDSRPGRNPRASGGPSRAARC